MTFSQAPDYEDPKSSGVTMSVILSHRTQKVRFSLSKRAQQKYFGVSAVGLTADILVGEGPDEGTVKIVLNDEGSCEFGTGTRGASFISAGIWDSLPRVKRPATQCKVISHSSGSSLGHRTEIVLAIPVWDEEPAKAPDGMREIHSL